MNDHLIVKEMAFDCLFQLKMFFFFFFFLARNAKISKNKKLIAKMRQHSVDTCL